MIRWFDAMLIALMVGAATTTFWIKYDAREVRAEIAALERRVATELSAIELNAADWSLLSQPDRLQELVEAHEAELGLRVTAADQFVSLSRLSAELDALAPASVEDALAGLLDGIDTTATGSVR